MKRQFIATILLASLAGTCRAALDPEVNKPYHLRVVLHIAQDRVFPDFFKKVVKQELHDALQAALGEMGNVEVVTTHPRLKEVEAKGLLQGLDDWQEISEIKTHFVLIDFVKNNYYQIQSRQHDGLTGMASPKVRRALLRSPAERQLVARTAAKLIGLDLGLIGTALPQQGRENEVRLVLKASQIRGVDMKRWVQPGDVFALAQISRKGPSLQSSRVDWAYVQVLTEPDAGVCRCHLYFRYKPNPLQFGLGVLGLRCLKLGTTTARLRLRLVDEKTRTPNFSRSMNIGADGFGFRRETLTTDVDGLVQTQKTYQNMAFVEVLDSAGKPYANVPVPILDDRVVTCPVNIDAKAEQAANLLLQKRFLMGRINDDLGVVGRRVKQLNQLVEKKDHQAALDDANKSSKELEAFIARDNADLAALRRQARELRLGPLPSFEDAEQLIKQLISWQNQLKDYIAKMTAIIQDEKDPRRVAVSAAVQNAKLQESRANFDQALAAYEKALKELKDSDAEKKGLQAHVDKLKKDWRLKSEEHRRARNFIYRIWPQQTTAQDIKDHLRKAQQAFATCKKVGDRLSLLKLLLTAPAQNAGLEKELQSLKSSNNEDARNKRNTVADVSEALGKFYRDVQEYLQETEPAKG